MWTSLSDMVDGNAWLVFKLIDMDASRWLNKAAIEWATDSHYLYCCELVHSTKRLKTWQKEESSSFTPSRIR